MGGAIGQQGSGRGSVLAMLGLVAAATAGYFFAVPGGTTGGMLFKESTAAGTPAAGERVVYAKSGGMYQKDSAGAESNLGGGTQNGTTGATANAIVKAASANTLADTGLFEAAGGRLAFGGVTASYPAIQRSTNKAQFVLADNSDYAPIECGAIQGHGVATVDQVSVTGILGITNAGVTYLANIATPTPVAGYSLIYAKDVAGTSKLFAMDGAGAETQLTP